MTNAKQILSTSIDIIGSRAEEYGDASQSFSRASTIASTMLDKTITAYDVSIVLMAVKMARIAQNKTHMDSYVDLAAYTAFAAQFSNAKATDAVEANRLQITSLKLTDEMTSQIDEQVANLVKRK
jgi:hypothetical protein